MKVLDLFCGTKGWSAPWKAAGDDILTSDIDPRFDPDLLADIRDVTPRTILDVFGQPDVILASPPCETFSVASIGTHWDGGRRAYLPKTKEAHIGIELVEHTRWLIEELNPLIAVVENPRGVLRKLPYLADLPRVTVWYCHYGTTHAKPTDLWGMPFPAAWRPFPLCHNRRPNHPQDCCCHDHEAAPRGAKTGTQGRMGAERARVPYALSLQIRAAL